MITIINYGLGNVQAFANVYKRLNIPAAIARNAQDLDGASKLILPGVGAFDHAMELLDNSGMRGAVEELVLRKAVPNGVAGAMRPPAASRVTLRTSEGRSTARQRATRLPKAWPTRCAGPQSTASMTPATSAARSCTVMPSSEPLLRGKTLVHGAPAVYLCRNYACEAPITDPRLLKTALDR